MRDNKFKYSETRQVSLTNIMLEFVRAAVLERMPVISSGTKIDWDKLMDISQNQGLVAWVWDGICKLPIEQQPPRESRIGWGMSAQDIWDRYEKQKRVLHDIVSLCEQHQMRLMLLKGIGLSLMFPNPHSRPSGDIDIFLFGDFEKGNELFADYKCGETRLHTSFIFLGVEVENHKTLVFHNSKVKGLVGDYLRCHIDDVVLGSERYYTFAPIPNLIYLLMHALNHVNYASDETIFPLKFILDIGMFIRHNKVQLPSDRVLRTMAELHLNDAFELVVYLSEWMLQVDLKEYHSNSIRQNNLEKISKLFENQGLSVPLVRHSSLIKQSCAIWNRYRRLKPIAKYIPKKPKCSLWQITYYTQLSVLIRYLVGFFKRGSLQ